MMLTGQKVLITGGAGFIGSHLARRLLNHGAEVTLVDSLIPEYGGNLHNLDGIADRVHLSISNVRDHHSMRYLVQGVDLVFNLAGQTSHMDSMQDSFTDLDISLAQTERLVGRILSLPMYPQLVDDEVGQVIAGLRAALI